MPAESIHFVQIVNSWPQRAICFEPNLELPLCLSSSPTLASGHSMWVALHNLWTEPITLHAGHQMGTVEAAEVVEPDEATAESTPMSMDWLITSHLSPVQQRQLTQLLDQYRDLFSQDDDDSGQTPVLENTIET